MMETGVRETPLQSAPHPPGRLTPAPGQWAPKHYFLLSVIAGVPLLGVLALSAVLDQAVFGLLAVGLPLAGLIVWRPELGLMLMAVLAPLGGVFLITHGFTHTKAIGLFVFVCTLLYLLRTGRLEVKEGAFWLMVALATWGMLTVFVADYAILVWVRTATMFQLAGLVFVTLNVLWTRNQVRAYAWTLAIAGLGAAAIYVFLFRWGGGAQFLEGREFNMHRIVQAMLPTVFLSPWLYARSRGLAKAAVVVMVLLVLGAITASGARQTYVAVLVGMVGAVACYRGASFSRKALMLTGAFALLTAIVVFGWATGLWAEDVYERVQELIEKGLATGHRAQIWGQALKVGLENPLLGVGVGNFKLAMLRPGFILIPAAHNVFLAVFVEQGVLGLVLYTLFVIAVFLRLRRTGSPLVFACCAGLFFAANAARLAGGGFYTKTYWLTMALCLVVGLRFARGGAASPALNSPATGLRKAGRLGAGRGPALGLGPATPFGSSSAGG